MLRSTSRPLAAVLFTAIVAGCSQPSPAARTEALPADGGDLGKAYNDLAAAFKAADRDRAGKLLDAAQWHLADKQASWFHQFEEQMTARVVGGKRQGDRATLFVESGDAASPYYAMLNAKHVGGGWVFDRPFATGSSFSDAPRDCTASAVFPCKVASAPDAQVSGTIQSHKPDMLTRAAVPPASLLDGIGVRMLDAASKAPKSTVLLLSTTAINPKMLALSADPEQVKGWLGYPLLKLDIAADGKSAKLEFRDGTSPTQAEVSNGLTLDTATPGRVRGTLKTDLKDSAAFDLRFDIAIASECASDAYRCEAGGD